MAKISSIEKNKRRIALVKSLKNKRKIFKEQIYDKKISLEERFHLVMKLSKLPRNSAKNRIRSRCEVTGRARAVYEKFGLSRSALRSLALQGLVTGLIKGSW